MQKRTIAEKQWGGGAQRWKSSSSFWSSWWSRKSSTPSMPPAAASSKGRQWQRAHRRPPRHPRTGQCPGYRRIGMCVPKQKWHSKTVHVHRWRSQSQRLERRFQGEGLAPENPRRLPPALRRKRNPGRHGPVVPECVPTWNPLSAIMYVSTWIRTLTQLFASILTSMFNSTSEQACPLILKNPPYPSLSAKFAVC